MGSRRKRSAKNIYNNDYLGVVEDISDPKKIGRTRVRVEALYGRKDDPMSIPTEDLPWLEPSSRGNSFGTATIGKVVFVAFEDGDYYKGTYFADEHYDINLQKKLESLTDTEYQDFYAMYFDPKHQYYYQDGVGIMFDYVKSNINMTDSGDIKLNLKDNTAKLYIGSPDASQQMVLGNHFFDWMDTLMNVLIGVSFEGNLGAPVIPSPDLIEVVSQYQAIRSTFLSAHLYNVDNQQVKEQDRAFDVLQPADNWNTETMQPVVTASNKLPDPTPRPASGGNPTNGNVPPANYSDNLSTSTLPANPTPAEQARENKPFSDPLQNGQIPVSQMTASSFLQASFSDPTDERQYLLDAPATSLDKFLNSYEAQMDPSWSDIIATKGYQNLTRQQNARNQYPLTAPLAGSDPFGFANQAELYFGVDRSSANIVQAIKDYLNFGTIDTNYPQVSALDWLVKNGTQYGWSLAGRTSGGDVQWWHWIYNTPAPTPTVINLSSGINSSSGF
jgi:hypothetical protein